MRLALFIYFFVIALTLKAQNVIEWSPTYTLTLQDFQNPGTEIGKSNGPSFQSGTQIEFGFYMTNAEFMMTKNWNSKVKATFTRSASFVVAPDDSTAQLMVAFSQFDFDLAELYSRKLRKELYENKKAFSNITFMKEPYDRLTKEFAERRAFVSKETNFGFLPAILKQRHEEVLSEISTLSDFCQECKPPKKKKN